MSNLPYNILEHSGDLRVLARGDNFVEALANASSGLLSQIVPPALVRELEELPLSVGGDTDADQALAFLNELVFLAYGRRWVAKRVRLLTQCTRKGCLELDAVVVGEPVDPARHEFRYDIKAVTYHDFQIEEGDGIVTIEFVCDL